MQQSNWLEASTPLPSVTRIKPATRSWQSTGRQRPSSQTFASLRRQTSSRYAQMDFLSSLLASPVKTLALQGNKRVTMESEVYCSMKSSAWLGSFDLSSSCLKMLEIYSLTKTGRRSKKPSFKLPKQGTMQNGQLFQQVMWEPVTEGSAFGLLPTPRRGETSDLKSTPGDHFSLSAWARQGQWMLRTPTTGMVNQDRSQDPSYMSKLIAKGQTVTLAAQIKSEEMGLLPTPTEGDSKGRGYFYQRKNGVVVGWNPSLCGALGAAKVPTTLPTPTTRDWKDGSQQACRNTPPNGLLEREIHHAQCSPLNGPPMYLNPSFVEEMMGYPVGWTDLSN